MDTTSATIVLGLVVLLAFSVEAALGFGATLVTVTLGALVLPVDEVLPAFVPLNVLLSLTLAWSNRRHVRHDLLWRRIVPLMAIGLPLGMLAFARLDAVFLVRVYGVFIVVLAALELSRAWGARAVAIAGSPVGLPAEVPHDRPYGVFERFVLIVGGVVHGAFGTGGPMVVYVSGRLLTDKAEFRATLSALWLLLNVVLLASYALGGRLDGDSVILTASLAPALAVGLVVGNVLHHRIPAERFRRAVFVMLAVAGVVLALG